jgi:shikimate kinase
MKRIFLVGFMGAGKTTLGKALAQRLNLSYIDTDFYIENRYRKKVSAIFAAEGEKQFRHIEHRMISEIAEFEDIVVSTGGGLPCFYDNMHIMNQAGLTVFVDVSVNELAARLENSITVRPVLQGRSGVELRSFIAEKLNERSLFYKQAKICFDANVMKTEWDLNTLTDDLERQINNFFVPLPEF